MATKCAAQVGLGFLLRNLILDTLLTLILFSQKSGCLLFVDSNLITETLFCGELFT